MTLFLCLPFCFMLAAYLWQLVPGNLARRLEKWRPLFILVPLVGGVMLSFVIGGFLEDTLFSGEIKTWLAVDPVEGAEVEGMNGSAMGGWFCLWLPLSALITGSS